MSQSEKTLVKKTPFINRTQVRAIAHRHGCKATSRFMAALDTVIQRQLERACQKAKNRDRKLLKDEWVTELFL